MSRAQHASIGSTAANIKKEFEEAAAQRSTSEGRVVQASELIEKGGIENLTDAQRRSLQSYINLMADHGIFIVKYGVLESWLRDLGDGVRKNRRLAEMSASLSTDNG